MKHIQLMMRLKDVLVATFCFGFASHLLCFSCAEVLFRDCRCGLLCTTADGSSLAAFPKGGTAVTGFVMYRGLHVLVSGGLCQSCSILVKRKKKIKQRDWRLVYLKGSPVLA